MTGFRRWTETTGGQPGVRTEAAGGHTLIERLQRWQDFGAVWRVTTRTAGTVTIALCRCDGGEEIDRLTSDDPDLVAWLAGRTSSEQ